MSEQAQDGPTTRKPHDTPFSEWAVLPVDDVDGVTWYFHVPTAALATPPAVPLDVKALADALVAEEWNNEVSPPAAIFGYRGWAERLIARLSDSKCNCNAEMYGNGDRHSDDCAARLSDGKEPE